MSKRKRQPEPFDVADFLRPHDDDMRSAVAHMFRGSPNLATANTPSTSSPAVPDASTPGTGIPETGAGADSGTPVLVPQKIEDLSAPASEEPFRPTVKVPRIRQALSMRDGHSLGEHAVYQALWENASPQAQNCRKIAIGYRTLSGCCGLTVNNCKANLRSLVKKLAIEEVAAFSPTQSRTYLVFTEPAILQRRRSAGLTHVVRSRAVTFVNPSTGQPLI